MKYVLTGVYKIVNGVTVYQIKSLVSIPLYGVDVDDLGGFVEGEHNLSQYGSSWIGVNATVYGTVTILSDAYVGGSTIMYKAPTIDGRLYMDGNFEIRYSKIFDPGHP